MPPRHGKSELSSKYFPAWYVGTYPNRKIILCSYEANFAADWGGKARDLLEEHGPAMFGVSVRPDQRARDDWRVDGRDGGMMTAGVGGPVTGKGAHLLIVDDPVKNKEEADSPTYREKTWGWWNSTAYTRVEPEGSVLVIQTRWHEDDLAGRLIAQQRSTDPDEVDDERWEVLNLPAIAEEDDAMGREPGEPLWPERWSLARLLRRMKRVGSVVWNALFQQRPTDPEGGFFKRSWFRIVDPDRVPRIVESTRCWDLAATVAGEKGNTDPDWLAGVKIGKGEDGRYYVLHCHAERTTAEGVEKTIKQFGMTDGRRVKVRIEQEGAASGKIVKYHYERMMDGWDCRFTGIPRGSKATRAGPLNAACERGDVLLVAGDWNEAFIDELARFPSAAHDDRMDAAAGAYNDLAGGPDDPLAADDWAKVVSYDDDAPRQTPSDPFAAARLARLRQPE